MLTRALIPYNPHLKAVNTTHANVFKKHLTLFLHSSMLHLLRYKKQHFTHHYSLRILLIFLAIAFVVQPAIYYYWLLSSMSSTVLFKKAVENTRHLEIAVKLNSIFCRQKQYNKMVTDMQKYYNNVLVFVDVLRVMEIE